MAAEVHLDLGREPPEAEAVVAAEQEGGFREVHFPRHRLHPRGVHVALEQADGGGIPREGAVGERVDMEERQRHECEIRD